MICSNDQATSTSVEFDIQLMSHADVITLPSLSDSQRLLRAIDLALKGDALAIVSQVDPEISSKAAEVAKEVAVEDYRVAPGFAYQADAAPLFEVGSESDLINYLENGARYEGSFAARMHPLRSPARIVEEALSKALPGGVARLRIRGKTAPFGVVRHLMPQASVLEHTDNSDLDKPEIGEFKTSRTNLSTVVYLEPGVGGELKIWRKRLTTRSEIGALRLPGHPYALDRRRLPEPDVVIRPAPGLVVIFDAKHIHAVGQNRGNTSRVTQSGFVAIGENGKAGFSYY